MFKDGDKFTSSSHGFRLESINTSNPNNEKQFDR